MNEQLLFQLVFDVLGQDGVDKLRAAMDAAKKSAGELSPEMQAAAKQIDELTNKASKVEAFAALKAQTNDTALKLKEAQAGLAALNSEFDRSDTSSAKVTRAFAVAEQQVASLTLQHNGLSAQLARSGADLERSGISTTNLAAAHADLTQKVGAAAQNFVALSSASVTHVSAMQSLKNGVTATTGAIKELGTFALETGKRLAEITGIAGLVTGALAAITGFKFFEAGAEDAAKFDDALAHLRITTGATGDELDKLKDAAENAGKATNTSAAESADALASLTSQLGSTDAALQALTPTLELARVAQISVADAVKIVSESLKAFNVPAAQTQDVVDQLAAVALKTGANLGALTSSFGQLAPQAKELGLSFKDTVDILGLLQTKGINAEQATKSLRGAFTELNNPASALSKELAGLGISTSTLSGVIDGLAKAGPRGEEALRSLGSKGGNALLALVQAGTGGLQKFQIELGNTSGAANKAASILDDTFNKAKENFGRDLDEIAGKAQEGGLNIVTEELNKLDAELKKVADTPQFQRIKDAITGFVKVGIEKIDQFIQNFNFEKASQSIASFLSDAQGKFKAIGDALDGVGRVATGVGNSVGVVFNTLAGVIGATVTQLVNGAASALKIYESVRIAQGASREEILAIQAQEEALSQTAQDLRDKTKGYFDAAGKNISGLAEAINGSGAAAEQAAAKIDKHTDAVAKLVPEVEEARKKYDALPESVRKSLPSFDQLIEAAGKAAAAGKTAGDVLKESAEKSETAAKNSAVAFELQQQKIIAARDAADQARAKLVALAESGDANSDAFRQAQKEFADAEAKLRTLSGTAAFAKPNLHDLESAAGALGFTLQQTLAEDLKKATSALETFKKANDGSAAAVANEQNAFIAYAAKKLAAAAQLGDAAYAEAKAQLAVEAAVEHVSKRFDEVIRSSDGARRQIVDDASDGSAALDNEAEHLRKLRGGFSGGNGDGKPPLDEGAKKAADEIKSAGDQGGASLAELDNALGNTRQSFLNVSEAAAKVFDTRLEGDFASALDSAGNGALGFSRVIIAMNQAIADTTRDIANQRAALTNDIADINKLGTSATAAFGGFGQSVKLTNEHLDDMIARIQNGTYDAGLLGQQDLEPLLQALQAAKQRMDALKAATEQANQQLADLNQQLQDERDQQTGNAKDIEDRRYEKQVKQIKDLEAKADAAGKAQAEQDLQLAAQIHAQKLKDIENQAAAQKQANQQQGSGANSNSGGGGPLPTSSGGNGGSNSGGAAALPSGITHQTTINLGDGQSINVFSDKQNSDAFAGFMQQLRFAKART